PLHAFQMWLRTDYAHAPQRCVYVMPYSSNIDVARCGWDVGKYEQWRMNRLWNPKRGCASYASFARAFS
ncbi:MAG: hypothetical protein K2N54_05900, partial [Helicobacter sp.]|nr:hypothetical protein [Helicobacter sp.]